MATKSTKEFPYQVMRSLTTEEFRVLKASIEIHGILEPVVVDEDGTIIDGHHRAKAAKALGIEVPTKVLKGYTHDEKLVIAQALNRARRHLTQHEQREYIAEHLLSDPKASNREIARRTGADDKTVGSVRNELIAEGQLPDTASRSRKPKPEPQPEPEAAEADTITDEEGNEYDEPLVEVEAPAAGQTEESVSDASAQAEESEPATLFESVMHQVSGILVSLETVQSALEGAGLEAEQWQSIAEARLRIIESANAIVVPE